MHVALLLLFSILLLYFQIPNVKWEDVGGLEDVKKAILDTVQVLLLAPFCRVKDSYLL